MGLLDRIFFDGDVAITPFGAVARLTTNPFIGMLTRKAHPLYAHRNKLSAKHIEAFLRIQLDKMDSLVESFCSDYLNHLEARILRQVPQRDLESWEASLYTPLAWVGIKSPSKEAKLVQAEIYKIANSLNSGKTKASINLNGLRAQISKAIQKQLSDLPKHSKSLHQSIQKMKVDFIPSPAIIKTLKSVLKMLADNPVIGPFVDYFDKCGGRMILPTLRRDIPKALLTGDPNNNDRNSLIGFADPDQNSIYVALSLSNEVYPELQRDFLDFLDSFRPSIYGGGVDEVSVEDAQREIVNFPARHLNYGFLRVLIEEIIDFGTAKLYRNYPPSIIGQLIEDTYSAVYQTKQIISYTQDLIEKVLNKQPLSPVQQKSWSILLQRIKQDEESILLRPRGLRLIQDASSPYNVGDTITLAKTDFQGNNVRWTVTSAYFNHNYLDKKIFVLKAPPIKPNNTTRALAVKDIVHRAKASLEELNLYNSITEKLFEAFGKLPGVYIRMPVVGGLLFENFNALYDGIHEKLPNLLTNNIQYPQLDDFNIRELTPTAVIPDFFTKPTSTQRIAQVGHVKLINSYDSVFAKPTSTQEIAQVGHVKLINSYGSVPLIALAIVLIGKGMSSPNFIVRYLLIALPILLLLATATAEETFCQFKM